MFDFFCHEDYLGLEERDLRNKPQVSLIISSIIGRYEGDANFRQSC